MNVRDVRNHRCNVQMRMGEDRNGGDLSGEEGA